MSRARALALFSGGLDSILACRLLQEQGVEVLALKFVTPFADRHLLDDPAAGAAYCRQVADRWGIALELCDLGGETLAMLRAPRFGFGRHFNPCIDCKILMLRRARQEMERRGADFLISGEVVGQRPMSQRRDTMRLIARESGCDDILLRPLSARLLAPTRPEREGLVRREPLPGLAGRGRSPQLALARHFALRDVPEPAGGCLLTDPNLSRRVANLYGGVVWLPPATLTVADARVLLLGRQFSLDGGAWALFGRDERENGLLAELVEASDWTLELEDRAGPLAILRREGQRPGAAADSLAVQQAASLLVRLGRRLDGLRPPAQVRLNVPAGGQRRFLAAAATEEQLSAWRM